MKLKTLLFAIPLSGLMLSSCNLENDPTGNYTSGSFVCCNLISNASGDSYASLCSYKTIFYYTDGTMQLSTDMLNLDNTTYSFTSGMMNCDTKYYSVDGQSGIFDVTSFAGGSVNTGKISVENIKGFTSSLVNILSTNDPVNPAFPFTPYIPMVMSYTVDNKYNVKTFMPDAIYTGTTEIRSAGSNSTPFTNDGIRYRVVFQKDLKKADIIFYNAKFADRMPITINFVLKDLDVEYSGGSYVISNAAGEPINPWMYEASGLTENPNYKFTSFRFINSSDDLTIGQAFYTVQMGEAIYNGEFNGFYVSKGSN